MFLKRKQRAMMKAKRCAEGHYHQIFNHKIESSSHLVQSCAHKGCYMMNTMNYHHKLMSVIGQKDEFTANKWTWLINKYVSHFCGHG